MPPPRNMKIEINLPKPPDRKYQNYLVQPIQKEVAGNTKNTKKNGPAYRKYQIRYSKEREIPKKSGCFAFCRSKKKDNKKSKKKGTNFCFFVRKRKKSSHSRIHPKTPSTVRDVTLIRSLSFNTNSMSDVSLAKTPSVDGLIAYKAYGDNISNAGHDRILMEEEIHSEMEHENIVRLHGRGEKFHQSPSLVMEFIDGEDLHNFVKKNHPIPMKTIQKFMNQIIRAVEYIHSKGYIHGDLKTSNILIQKPHDTVKISDFGAALKMDSRKNWKAIGSDSLNGTPLFSAPEQIFADKKGRYKIGFTSDIYQIGLIFYEILTGKMPHEDVAEDSFNVFGVIMKLRKKYDNGKMLFIPTTVLPDPDAQAFFDSMIHVDFEKRPSIKQLKQFTWLQKKLE